MLRADVYKYVRTHASVCVYKHMSNVKAKYLPDRVDLQCHD